MPTRFGIYDPDKREHCDTLRDQIDNVPESTLGLIAEHLLNKYQLIAQVEVHEIPEFTREMLNQQGAGRSGCLCARRTARFAKPHLLGRGGRRDIARTR